MKKLKEGKKIIGVFIFLMIVLLGRMAYDEYVLAPHVVLAGSSFDVEIVDTAEGLAMGLSGREGLTDNTGMLFVLPEKIRGAFWMKDMKFSIDIIWINDNKVVGFHENLKPEGANPLTTYRSSELVDHVLELEAGEVNRRDVKIGDKIKYYGKRH